MFTLFEFLTRMDHVLRLAVIKALITAISERCKMFRLNNSRMFCRFGELMVKDSHLPAINEAFLILWQLHQSLLIRQLLPSRLHREVGLPECNYGTPIGVRVFDDQVTGITRKENCWKFSWRSFTCYRCFFCVCEMTSNSFSTLFTGFFCFANGWHELIELAIT